MDIIAKITDEFKLERWQVENTVKLIDEGNTIPFIARYRKEAHGTLDDQILREISERLVYLRNFEKRKEEISSSIEEAGALTDEIKTSLDKCVTLSELEDIYRPYKPKRKTRASVAKQKGLSPLADEITAAVSGTTKPETFAEKYIDSEKGVNTAEEALAGASDIIAETVSDNADIRKRIRNLFSVTGIVQSKAAKKDTESVYANYYEFSEGVEKIAGYKILALDRGEKEGFLKVGVSIPDEKAINVINSLVMKENGTPCADFVRAAGEDAYTRLIEPSVEREIRSMMTERADAAAIKVFGENLRPLLMQPPVKNKTAIGLDPGYRTGCKVAVVDGTGKVLDTGVIYITHGQAQEQKSAETIKKLIAKYGVEIISIGNGTASKETEIFAANLIKEIPQKVSYMVVSEAGASVYSASKLAAEEFPQYDVSLRSAVSIARRLQDPLAELVKIDPKAIGVGQYQHDMPPKELEAELDGVVEDCVNAVGADLNTASPSLLEHISGINSKVAKSIVSYREENGMFKSRSEIKKVPMLGSKAFEQCAGFLRIPESSNVLDNTGVHPESYKAAKELISLCGYDINDVKSGKIDKLSERTSEIGKDKVAEKLSIGIPTLDDIIKELKKPGRDPRDELVAPMLRTDVMDMKDLKPGMELRGTVRNVVDFGVFVDIGVHQDGLVHISQITDRFIKHPSELLKVGDIVTVWVKEVDINKKRISLTMKNPGVKN